jgi:hypothetical protein
VKNLTSKTSDIYSFSKITPCEQLAIHRARQLIDCFACIRNPVNWRMHKEEKTVFEFTWNTSGRSSLTDLDLCDVSATYLEHGYPPTL